MKKLFLLSLIFFTSIFNTKATHFVGGEMSWTCEANGSYTFNMTFYRDCSGIPWLFQDEVINITGPSLPKDVTGAPISSILVKPDSNRWENSRQGNAAPRCTDRYGEEVPCSSPGTPEGNGNIQQFWYKSSYTLVGVPPTQGWKFSWSNSCCRPNGLANVNTSVGGIINNVVLRAFMYPTKDRDDVNPCMDNSPVFRGLPVSAICRGYTYTYNATAIDRDLDSLVYLWGRAENPPADNPDEVPYLAGYNFNNPTPDETFDKRNLGAQLGRTTGAIKMAIYSGVGLEKYLTVIRCDAYRDGRRISSVFRELPLSIFDCDKLPSGFVNKPAKIFIDEEETQSKVIEIVAGQKVNQTIKVEDRDDSGSSGSPESQLVTLVPGGIMFSKNRVKATPCQITDRLVEPCAYLNNKDPFLDMDESPPNRKVEGLAGVSSNFEWQTDCRHLQTKSGKVGERAAIYNFVMRVQDDHCPIPMINYATITVRVKDQPVLPAPILKGLSLGLDGKFIYQWAAPIDSAFSFEKYRVYYATAQEGFTPSEPAWGTIDDNIKLYSAEQKHLKDAGVYRFINNNAVLGPDLFNVNKGPSGKGLDWYLRMATVSGCEDTSISAPSDVIRIIEVKAEASGKAPIAERGAATVRWNAAKAANSTTNDYFKYDSKTQYYIWENDSINQATTQENRNAMANPENWYVRGNTDSLAYELTSNVCGEFVAFRVEARDTVITFKQGEGLLSDSIDTLTFSSFSTIDTVFMTYSGDIPSPTFERVEVLDNGDVFLKIDVANSGTINEFKLYENSVNGTLLETFEKKQTHFRVISGANANASVKNYVLSASDSCNTQNSKNGIVNSTIKLAGNLNICPATYSLTWNQPTGLVGGISSYEVYAQRDGAASIKVATITDENITSADIAIYGRAVDYNFHVVAQNSAGSMNISAIHKFRTPSDLRTDEIVPAPELSCTEIQSDGSVKITFETPKDSTENTAGFRARYRTIGGTYSTPILFNDPAINEFTITAINANQQDYEFEVVTLSGCDGTTASQAVVTSTSKNFVFAENGVLKSTEVGNKYQWYDCNLDFIIRGATNATYRAIDTGLYSVIVYKNGCTDASDCFVFEPVGLKENIFQSELTYYPNPTDGKINIVANTDYQQLRVTVRTLTGQLVAEKQFANQRKIELDIEGKSGIYFVQLTNDKGERANIKVIKK